MSNLPTVSKDTIASVARYMDKNSELGMETFKDIIEEMGESNPLILQIIFRYSSQYGESIQQKMKISTCGLTVYKLLKSQSDSNKLKETLNFEN